ncbi:HNH endonuclease [Mycobacterium phage LittleLaf]|uniref:HNH endonuclease n=1 Tax=Mycobacterium phage LittleLaf TaxID=2301615 RepID=A0A385UK94_9CAUD|nr:HNH endonuclease [Mycobacterium phage LittleLaf]
MERLEHYTDKSGDCWLWTGTQRKGYGLVWCGPEIGQREAHIVTWELENGGLGSAAGHVIRHTCDTPLCRKPSHLISGTHADNVADKIERGREARGSGHGLAKVNEASVLEIRERYAAGADQRTLARLFGVSQATISLIVNRKTWTHI